MTYNGWLLPLANAERAPRIDTFAEPPRPDELFVICIQFLFRPLTIRFYQRRFIQIFPYIIYTIDRETPDHDLQKATHEELDRIAPV